MPEKEIEIKHIRVSELYQFAQDTIEASEPGDFIPITLHRALAMFKNPYATGDEVAMLVAYTGTTIIGYFGIMTVKIQHAGELHRAQWFTTWMVASGFTGRGVGSMLMQAALDLEQDYFIVGSKPARRVCDKFGFERLPPYEFTVIDFRLATRFNPVTLLLRGVRKAVDVIGVKLNITRLNRIAALVFERFIGPLIRPILYALALANAKKELSTFTYQMTERVRSAKPERGLDTERTSLYRGDQVVNWMLAYPWVLKPGESESEALDFFFSDTRKDFEIFAREVNTDEYRGYVAFQFSVIGDTPILKVLDVVLKTGFDYGFVLPLALEIAKQMHTDLIEIPSEYTTVLERGMLGKMILTKKQHICQVHPHSENSPLGRAWRDLELSIVDGDTAFS